MIRNKYSVTEGQRCSRTLTSCCVATSGRRNDRSLLPLTHNAPRCARHRCAQWPRQHFLPRPQGRPPVGVRSLMMDVFDLRQRLVDDYQRYTRSFIKIRDPRINAYVDHALGAGAFWPEPLLQLNPTFLPGGTIDDLTD